ncbi:MAG: glutamate dehydrogenase, partial [Candidatus Azotimanducaceae bacterium]
MIKEQYLSKLISEIDALNPSDSSALVTRFSSLFWQRAIEEDIASRNPSDDAGFCIDSWRLFERRGADEVVIRLINPVLERDGWHAPCTMVTVMAKNMPFTVDSILMALSHDGIVTHFLNNVVYAVERDAGGKVTNLSLDTDHDNRELFIFAEVDRLSDADLPELEARLNRTSKDLFAAVTDFSKMKLMIKEVSESVLQIDSIPKDDVIEAKEFLAWLQQDNFTFLGFREFDYRNDTITQVGDPLGVLRIREPATSRRISDQPDARRDFLLEPVVLSFSKGGRKSLVHRPAYPDYVGIKKFNDAGEVVGEYGFLGLYTSRVYTDHPGVIPVVRKKLDHVVNSSEFESNGFDGKVLKQVIATYPRDELFQISEHDLLHQTTAVTNFHERRKIKLFVREDRYGLFVNCLIYMPRDLFDTRVSHAVEKLLVGAFNAEDAQYDTLLSESILVRLQYILRVTPASDWSINVADLEKKIASIINDWRAELDIGLADQFGEVRGRELLLNYVDAFSAGYREYYSAAIAVADIGCIEAMPKDLGLNTRLYHLIQDDASTLRLKVFHQGSPLPLSDQVPKLENLGFRITEEKTYRVQRKEGSWITIHDFKLFFETQLDLLAIGDLFNESFSAIWLGVAEDDSFNRLILGAGLNWRQVNLLRVYARYMKQIGFAFGQTFISDTLFSHQDVGRMLVHFFEARMSPGTVTLDPDVVSGNIVQALEDVSLLNEDRVLRRIHELMLASLRTNYFQKDQTGKP